MSQKIATGITGTLTLIAAPAGFGKTTLVAASVSAANLTHAWLSLDRSDNPLERFLSYLISALQTVNPHIGVEAVQLMDASSSGALEGILTSLLNDLELSRIETILVLDDYQVIHNPQVHSALAFLLDHCPPTLHLVISTRADPPLPLARLRARGQLAELRASDMRFTQEEAVQFMREVMGLSIDDGAVARLSERTEGWIAGLQMAALSLRDRDDIPQFISGFSGTNRYILDYLFEEVLSRQPPAHQRFLLCTSILERLSVPLCDAVLEAAHQLRPGQEDRLSSEQALMDLERGNVFLLPLDDERNWYRYHHLFADLLRMRLTHVLPGLAPHLHVRAAAWLEKAGLPVEATNHALAAEDYDLAASLVEKNTTRLLERGEMRALMSWIEALPAEVRARRPWLCVHQAYALANAGRLTEVPALLEQAEAAAVSGIDTGDQALAGSIAAVKAMSAVMLSQDAEAIAYAQKAKELLPASSRWDRSVVAWSSGYSLRSQGQLEAAGQAFQEQIELGRAMGNIWTLVTGMTDLGQIYRSQGRLREAQRLFETALDEASHQGARSLGYIARVETGLASVLCEQNDLEAAQYQLAGALEHVGRWPNPNHLAFTHVVMARVLLAQGEYPAAWRAAAEAIQATRRAPVTRLLQHLVEGSLVRVWLALRIAGVPPDPGDHLVEQAHALILSWELTFQNTPPGQPLIIGESQAVCFLALAQAYLVDQQNERGRAVLQRLVPEAETHGAIDAAVQAQVLLCQAYAHSGDSMAAAAALHTALDLAQPGGYMRVFLEGGSTVRDCLSQLDLSVSSPAQQAYAARILAQFDAMPALPALGALKAAAAAPEGISPAVPIHPALVEPLSPRETEVLALLAQGKTNQEIARLLVVAPGTVKAHTASIYRKLDVSNRTEAAARARALGIL